jgi:hypothetical protein
LTRFSSTTTSRTAVASACATIKTLTCRTYAVGSRFSTFATTTSAVATVNSVSTATSPAE